MNSRIQHLLRTTSALLVLAVLLSGPASSVTALEARQEPPPKLVVQGYGDFPRLPVVAPGADGSTLALYLVEGDTATQLVTLEGTRAGSNRADVRLSPDGRYVACLRTEGEYMRRVLEVADTQEDRRVVIAEGAKGVHQRGAGSETLTSVAWMDAGHILYSKVQWPNSQEREASWEAETPLPVQGEIWLSDVGGEEQRLLATGRIYRVLGASPEGQTLYVTRLIPGREEWREEGFALVDVELGEMKNLWPEEERGVEKYHNFKLTALPDGSRRLLFTTRTRGDSAATEPPVIWMADPESGQAEAIWTIDQGKDWSKGEMTGTIYDTPRDFLWSPRSEHEFIYLAGDVLGGVWHVDLETGKAEPLGQVESWGRAGLRLLAWVPEGIVIQNQDVIWLLDENGEVQGEIRFREGEERLLAPSQVSSVVVDWDVPYVHQLYDTPAWFHGGWACGPTSVVMALAYYDQLSGDYGWYVPNEYTHQSACSGEHTFDRVQDDAADPPHEAWGAYGTCTNNGYAVACRMYEYAEKHDVGHYFTDDPDEVTEGAVKGELDRGAVVILRTGLLGGHIVLARGYTDDSTTKYIVNDPYGDEHNGYPNNDGDGARYTWAEMGPTWYIALYGPEYLPYLYESSTWDSTITIQNGAPEGFLAAHVDVCFMYSHGSLNTTESHSIPVKGSWNLSLSDVFGGYFSGSGVVVSQQTAVSAVVRRVYSNKTTSYTGVPARGSGAGWDELSQTIYVPAALRYYYNWNSTFYIQNASGETASGSITFYNANGSTKHTEPVSISANGRKYLSLSNITELGSNFGGSAVVNLNRPVAVVVSQRHSSSGYSEFNAFTSGATTLYLPSLLKNYYGWNSAAQVQNIGNSGTYVRVRYSNGLETARVWVPKRSYHVFMQANEGGLPNGWIGSAQVFSEKWASGVGWVPGEPIVAIVNQQEGNTKHQSYSALLNGATSLYVPFVAHDAGSDDWRTSFQVQNVDSSTANVWQRYYDTDGTAATNWRTNSVSPGASVYYLAHDDVPAGYYYSSLVMTPNDDRRRLGGICNMLRISGSGDASASYNLPGWDMAR